jgi:hypothetical protein
MYVVTGADCGTVDDFPPPRVVHSLNHRYWKDKADCQVLVTLRPGP